MSEPFWCGDLDKYLQIIPNEEADKIYHDVQLYCKHRFPESLWGPDRDPETYRNNRYSLLPSSYQSFAHAIEVHVDKPEYVPS